MADSSTHWSRISESGTILGMRFMLLMSRVFGRGGFRLFLYPVMLYYYLAKPAARAASRQFQQQIAPLLPAAERARLSPFRNFIMFGEILLDKMLVWTGRIRREDVIFETPDTIDEIEKNRKGGIIIVSHLGNFEICSALADKVPDLQMTILIYTRHAQKFNKLLKRVSGSDDVEIMQVTDVSPITAMQLAERVRAGGYVVIAGDRTPVTGENRVSRVRFLGRGAALPQGAFILAGLFKCPVYLLFCLKHKERYHVWVEHFGRLLDFGERARRSEILDDAVQRFAHRLEHYCKMAPLQWFNFFPYWERDSADDNEATAGKERDIRI